MMYKSPKIKLLTKIYEVRQKTCKMLFIVSVVIVKMNGKQLSILSSIWKTIDNKPRNLFSKSKNAYGDYC